MEKESHDIRLKINPEIYPELYEMLDKVKRKSRGDLLIRLAHDALMGNHNIQYNTTHVDKIALKNNNDQIAKVDGEPDNPFNPNEILSNFDEGAFDDFFS